MICEFYRSLRLFDGSNEFITLNIAKGNREGRKTKKRDGKRIGKEGKIRQDVERKKRGSQGKRRGENSSERRKG